MPILKCPPGIVRVDNNGYHGFYARICRQGEKYQKGFADALYGGKRAALAVATQWWEEMNRTLPPKTKPGPRGSREALKKKPARRRRAA